MNHFLENRDKYGLAVKDVYLQRLKVHSSPYGNILVASLKDCESREEFLKCVENNNITCIDNLIKKGYDKSELKYNSPVHGKGDYAFISIVVNDTYDCADVILKDDIINATFDIYQGSFIRDGVVEISLVFELVSTKTIIKAKDAHKYTECLTCGKEFRKVNKTHKFCTQDCRVSFKHVCTCTNCEKSFRNSTKVRYCSIECRKEYFNKTKKVKIKKRKKASEMLEETYARQSTIVSELQEHFYNERCCTDSWILN